MMESKLTPKPPDQLLQDPASNQMLGIELTAVWHQIPAISSQQESHAKIFKILFVKELCFQSDEETCFTHSSENISSENEM